MAKVSVEESETPSGKPVRKANEDKAIKRPIIGMLCWEAGFPRGLAQLEELPGNATNPATFNFPVRYAIQQTTNLPVFDIVTLINMVYEAIERKRYERPFH